MLCHVAHAFEGRADAQRTDDDPQVASDRLLAREDLDRQFVEDHCQLIDLRVIRDDRLGKRHVGVIERLRRILYGDDDELSDLHKAILNFTQLLLEYFTHRISGPSWRERAQMTEPFGSEFMMSRTG